MIEATFTFRMTTAQRVLAVVSFLAMGLNIALRGVLAWEERSLWHLAPALLYAATLAATWGLVLRPMPSRVVREGEDLVFHDLPCRWVNAGHASLAFGKRGPARVPVAAMVPEWIGASLTWNDLGQGTTVWLARGAQARALMAWLKAQGVAEPVVGPPA